LTARREATSLAAGREAFGLRDYAPGDDYRRIDWKLCARRDELLTKVFPPYGDRHTYVLLDCSLSMGLGSPEKFHLACRIAGLLGYAALEQLECLHVTGFADGPVSDTGPLRGGARIGRLMRFLHDLPMQGSQTDLARTAAAFARRSEPHGPVAVISDLYEPPRFPRGVRHPLAPRLPAAIVSRLRPMRSGARVVGRRGIGRYRGGTLREATITEWAAARYRQRFAEFCQSVRDYCHRRVIPLVQVANNVAEGEVLKRVLEHTRNSRRLTAAGAVWCWRRMFRRLLAAGY